MSLNDLEQKLYDPDSGIEKRKHEESGFNPLVSSSQNSEKFKAEKKWEKVEDTGKSERSKAYKIGAIALSVVALISILLVGYVKFKQSAFSADRVTIKIEGPAEAGGSEDSNYRITLENDNRIDLSNVQITLDYAENFKPNESDKLKINDPAHSKIILGTVKGNSKGSVDISGSFFATKDTIVYLNAVVEYTPSNFSIKYQAKGQIGVNVNSSPLSLEVQAPQEITSGSKIDYVVNFKNLSEKSLEGVRLKVEYPEGFSFISSDIVPSEGNDVWYLGNLNPNQEGKLVITGSIKGLGNEGKMIKAFLGYASDGEKFIVYNQKETITRMTEALLSISQSIYGKTSQNVDANEPLRYILKYKNNGNIALNDVIITEEIDSRVLNFPKLELRKGSYDASKKTITWKAAEIPALANLAPGGEGEISFSIPVLDRIPVENQNDNNFTIISTAKIDSPTIPNPIGSNKVISSDRMEMKLNSKIVLDVKGYYKDSAIENSGPLPPKVGQETSYTIHWKIINVSNNINDVKVSSYLPSGVVWKGKTFPESEAITFNDRTNQVEWDLGSLKNGVGILDPAREVSFQVSIVPQVNQVGREVVLLNPSILTAKDTFTGVDAKVEVVEKDNKLLEDTSVNGKYKVEQ